MKITLKDLKLIIENFLLEENEEESPAAGIELEEPSEDEPSEDEPSEEPSEDEPSEEPSEDEPSEDESSEDESSENEASEAPSEDESSEEPAGESPEEKEERIEDAASNLSGPEALIAYGGMLNLGGKGKIPPQAKKQLASKAGDSAREILEDETEHTLASFQARYEQIFNAAKTG